MQCTEEHFGCGLFDVADGATEVKTGIYVVNVGFDGQASIVLKSFTDIIDL